ncbi:MAG: transposase [Flavobacteriales bacterium Tduv]
MKDESAYSGLSLFKMLSLIHWYDFSDVGTEELVKQVIIYMSFFGFRLED